MHVWVIEEYCTFTGMWIPANSPLCSAVSETRKQARLDMGVLKRCISRTKFRVRKYVRV